MTPNTDHAIGAVPQLSRDVLGVIMSKLESNIRSEFHTGDFRKYVIKPEVLKWILCEVRKCRNCDTFGEPDADYVCTASGRDKKVRLWACGRCKEHICNKCHVDSHCPQCKYPDDHCRSCGEITCARKDRDFVCINCHEFICKGGSQQDICALCCLDIGEWEREDMPPKVLELLDASVEI